MNRNKYNVVVCGGGTAGVASAYIAAKKGLNTLLVEKSDVLGGSITQGLVIPCMKVNTENINTEFIEDLKIFADKYNARITYNDSNEYWFNPELLKIVLDDMLKTVKCDVLFSTEPISVNFDVLFNLQLEHKSLSLYIETEYIVDATANGKIFKLLNYNFQEKNEKKQATSLRFLLSNVDLSQLSDWLLNIDSDRDVTTSARIDNNVHLSTAYTWDNSKNWALAPIFNAAIDNDDLEYDDTAYFQIFTVATMPNTLAFNCPRIILDDNEDILDPFVYSKALKQGRERIYRLYNFVKKYFKGCENSFISHISDTLGIRETYRVKGKYTYTKEDIISARKFDNIAFTCNYPIDIHSNNKDEDILEFTNHTYYVPIETLISADNDNLYGVGRIISADFEAQAAIRTQISCFSMGEAAAKDIYKKTKESF
ncbi:MAG: FAD-dependent oxidoreductase [Candidatus Gastranaerophilales bacterium]|nr:FAD-dependent oxidoreductase [Candidatus Gastranaerophilales bacterium]